MKPPVVYKEIISDSQLPPEPPPHTGGVWQTRAFDQRGFNRLDSVLPRELPLYNGLMNDGFIYKTAILTRCEWHGSYEATHIVVAFEQSRRPVEGWWLWKLIGWRVRRFFGTKL